MLLNIVSDEELLVSQIIKIILLIISGTGILYNIRRIFQRGTKSAKLFQSAMLAVLGVVLFFLIRAYRIESALLGQSLYAPGTTLGYCEVIAEGQGISFEYEVNGKKILNCNTFHPIVKNSIKVPGGKYWVRYSSRFPDKGRMDFSRAINDQ